MSRDDSSLYTGINSASFNKSQAQKKERQVKRAIQKAALTPAGEIINAEFEKEKLAIALKLGELINIDMDKEDIKSVLLGLREAQARVSRLQDRILKMLKEQPQEESDEEEL